MRKILFVISLLFVLLFTGCVYDDVLEGGCGSAAEEPFTLSFTVGVPAMDSGAPTRAIFYGNPLYYEDWIDTQNGLRVLFFISKREQTGVAGTYKDDDKRVASDPTNPLKDYFLFESTSRWVTQLPYDDSNNLRYRITVPVYQIGNEDSGYSKHWETIRKWLREYDFKVAILANHPEGLNWTVSNSVLSANNINDLRGEKNIKTINDIHHSVYDRQYHSGSSGRAEGYDMLRDGSGNMGPFIDWVTMRSELYGDALGGTFNSKETALTWVRDYWNPNIIYNEDTDPDIDYQTLYHNYRHVWSYWNFGGAATDNALPYSTKSRINKHIGEWEVRNGRLLRELVTTAVNNGGTLSELSTAPSGVNKYDGSLPLTLHPSSAKAVITTPVNGTRLYGIQLPSTSAPSNTSSKDCFYFKLNASGSVVVRSSGGTIALKCSITVPTPVTSTQTVNGVSIKETIWSFTSNFTAPADCYIYSSSGTSVVYDIETVQDQYLYLTDREGILPSSDHPSPMYGVQKYGKLEGFWDEGAAFDLTDSSNTGYNAKKLSLLRAVSKIEVLIPKSLGVPKHVYMHSLNRNVRCEPVDVATPTDELWKDHNDGCEWKLIQKHGPSMNSSGSYTVDDYKKKLAWYYGNWLEWGWDFNDSKSKPDYAKDGEFPRIMNPYINRSDCAAFIDVTDYYNDQYYHYLFYMGENTLDAPTNYSGNSSSTNGSAKVPHIEIRFDERYAALNKIAANSDLNLMDNDSYRIYFTEGGIAKDARDANGVSKIPYNQYSAQYENQTKFISEHWPIIRNHVYRFKVNDAGTDGMNGLVVDVEDRSADFDFN